MGENTQRKRRVHLDVLKIIAIYCVLFNHTGSMGFSYFTTLKNDFSAFAYQSLSVLCKVAVPLFLMSSGAMLLRKEESYISLFTKRVIKYTAILLAVSFINFKYQAWTIYGYDGSMSAFFEMFYTSNVNPAYWYLYMYIAFLLMLPFLRKMVKSMSNKDFLYFFIVYFLFQGISVLDFVLFKGEKLHNQQFYLFIAMNYVIFPFAGYFIENRLDKKWYRPEILILVIGVGMGTVFGTARLSNWYCSVLNDFSIGRHEYFYMTFVVIPSAMMYYCCKYLFDNITLNEKTVKVISILSRGTFGVYLFENIWREKLMFIYTFLSTKIDPFISCNIYVLVTCLIGILISGAVSLAIANAKKAASF